MQRKSLYFTAPGQIELRSETCPAPAAGEVLVRTRLSAISSGTELLIYRGQAPEDLAADDEIASLEGQLSFPLKYGYAAVGEVVACGPDVDEAWLGRDVFSFQPHQTHFTAPISRVIPLPEGISREGATFLPNMETAVNFVMDGRPLIGERVAVFGQGIVGLLTTALLVRFPLSALISLDRYPNRRQASRQVGADITHDPTEEGVLQTMRGQDGVDLAYELSGNPAGLVDALEVVGFAGRVVIGSWYGQKRTDLNLGGRFHRSRIRLISSQVSTLAPELRGRWDKARRFDVAWAMIRQVKPERLITQRIPFEQAERAYTLLDCHPEQAIQVLLDYEE
jgi:2-desacetyl-2-hydroxyethyl bacteriochlorophyllide A dehydrogenase